MKDERSLLGMEMCCNLGGYQRFLEQKYRLHLSSWLDGAMSSSETLISTYITKRRHNPQDHESPEQRALE